MKVNYKQFLAIVYADLFDYPLTVAESEFWGVEVEPKLHTSAGLVRKRQGILVLRGRERLVELRKRREEISKRKLTELIKQIEQIKLIPTVEGVFVTGSVAMGNAKRDSDVDLMVVTKRGTMWVTRILLVSLLKLHGIYRSNGTHGLYVDKACTNIFLDTGHLEIKEKNLYTAHEVLQARCVFDRGDVGDQWLRENRWVRKYLPGAYGSTVHGPRYTVKRRGAAWAFLQLLLLPVEVVAFTAEYLYMRKKITNERVGWGQAFFHPRDLSAVVMGKFERRLSGLGVI